MVKERFDSLQPPIIKRSEKDKKTEHKNNQNQKSKMTIKNTNQPEAENNEMIIPETKEQQINSNAKITEIIPTVEQQNKINELLGNNIHQVIIWNSYISQSEKVGSVLNKDEPLSLNICCAASGILAKVKPEIKIHLVTHDLTRFIIQPVYEFKINLSDYWEVFRLSYQLNPALSGFFKYNIILDVTKIDLFWFEEGSVFKIK